METSLKLVCGHPVECAELDEDEDREVCMWCDGLAALRARNQILLDQLHKHAVIVEAGATLHFHGQTIGLLELHGGSVVVSNGDYVRLEKKSTR